MLFPLLIGAGIVALIVAASKKNSVPLQMGIPTAGSVWTYTFELNKPFPPQAQNVALDALRNYLPPGVEIAYPPAFTDSTHGNYTLRYLSQTEYPVIIGATIPLTAGFTMTVTSATQAPAY
jgi:hypothetical protein